MIFRIRVLTLKVKMVNVVVTLNKLLYLFYVVNHKLMN